jgi:hypothetical protein
MFAELSGLRSHERVEMRLDDLDPYFTVYDWHPRLGLADMRRRTQNSAVSSSREVAMSSVGKACRDGMGDLEVPVNVGNALQLLGYELRTPTAVPGGTLELVTLWRATDPEPFQPEDLANVNLEPVLFVHALDATGGLLAQEDRLDAPAWDWQKGDVIAQSHRVLLPRDLASGLVNLEVGVYRRADLRRLPVLVDDHVVGDSVFFSPVDVKE